MGERILDLLVRGTKALRQAVLGVIKRHTTPPAPAERQNTYTDQW